MNQQRELIHLVCRLPESDQKAALAFLRALKAKNSPIVKQFQQQQQAEVTQLKNQLLRGTRQEWITMTKKTSELMRFFLERLDADLMLEVDHE